MEKPIEVQQLVVKVDIGIKPATDKRLYTYGSTVIIDLGDERVDRDRGRRERPVLDECVNMVSYDPDLTSWGYPSLLWPSFPNRTDGMHWPHPALWASHSLWLFSWKPLFQVGAPCSKKTTTQFVESSQLTKTLSKTWIIQVNSTSTWTTEDYKKNARSDPDKSGEIFIIVLVHKL